MNFATFSEELIRHRPRRAGGIIVVEQIDSTQQLARRVVEEYTREGSLVPDTDVLAWRQAAGRGRLGRGWSSPPGCGIYATLIRSQPEPQWLQMLPLQTAVTLCEVVNRYLDGHSRLKWPNDLMVGASKLGGILIDAVTQGEESSVAAISFGINHRADLSAIGESRATSVHREAKVDPVPSLASLAVELITAVDEEIGRDTPAAEIIARYERLSSHRHGDDLRCQIDEDLLEGRFLGFDEHGFLRLEVGDEERLLSTGEVLAGG